MIVRRMIKLSVFAFCAMLIGLFALLSASVYTFAVLTDEARIAELEFERLGEQRYLARLWTGTSCDQRAFEIYGDQWRIDAEFVKWKYWATLLGLDAQYRLDRLEGRYASARDQNANPATAHDLRPDTTLDLVDLSAALGSLNFLIDATYGSSTYNEIDTSRVHRVYRTQTGIITRSEPLPQRAPGESGLAVSVTRGCGAEPGLWQRFSRWTDARLAWLL